MFNKKRVRQYQQQQQEGQGNTTAAIAQMEHGAGQIAGAVEMLCSNFTALMNAGKVVEAGVLVPSLRKIKALCSDTLPPE